MRRLKTLSRFSCGVFFIVTGLAHFVNDDFFLNIMPPWIPFHAAMVYASGLAEIALGLGLTIERWSRPAAWGLIALLIAVFPANIHVFLNQDLIPAPPLLHLLRLPLQAVFILWAWWHTRVAAPHPDAHPLPNPNPDSQSQS